MSCPLTYKCSKFSEKKKTLKYTANIYVLCNSRVYINTTVDPEMGSMTRDNRNNLKRAIYAPKKPVCEMTTFQKWVAKIKIYI